MRELASKEIDGLEYQFEQFGAKKSLKILFRLSKQIGKPLSLLVGSMSGEKDKKLLDRDIKLDMIAVAIDSLMSNLDSDEVITLMQDLAGDHACICDGKKINFDSHYEGRLPHLFKVLWAAIEVQYGNFFDALSATPDFVKHRITK